MGGDGSFSLGYARSLRCKSQADSSPPPGSYVLGADWLVLERTSRPALDLLILQTKCAPVICHNKSKMTL